MRIAAAAAGSFGTPTPSTSVVRTTRSTISAAALTITKRRYWAPTAQSSLANVHSRFKTKLLVAAATKAAAKATVYATRWSSVQKSALLTR